MTRACQCIVGRRSRVCVCVCLFGSLLPDSLNDDCRALLDDSCWYCAIAVLQQVSVFLIKMYPRLRELIEDVLRTVTNARVYLCTRLQIRPICILFLSRI